MTIILLIRHGENDSIGKVLAGRTPGIHLNQKGKDQAERLADFLQKISLRAIYSSPLERACETAYPTSRLLNLPVITREGLLETDFGAWQGKPFSELRKDREWKNIKKISNNLQFPGGESIQDVQNRIVKEMSFICKEHQTKDVIACFTHSDVIRLGLAYYLNMPLNHYHHLTLDTASISTIDFRKDYTKIIHINHCLDDDKIRQAFN